MICRNPVVGTGRLCAKERRGHYSKGSPTVWKKKTLIKVFLNDLQIPGTGEIRVVPADGKGSFLGFIKHWNCAGAIAGGKITRCVSRLPSPGPARAAAGHGRCTIHPVSSRMVGWTEVHHHGGSQH